MILTKGGEYVDWEVLYSWLEQKTGVSYDSNEAFAAIQGNTVFTDTFLWCLRIGFILDDMESAIEAVEENKRELTEDLPPKDKLKKAIEFDRISKLRANINAVKGQLGMSETPINDAEDVMANATALRDLIMWVSALTVDELKMRDGWFETYDEETDGGLTEVLELHKNDLIDIFHTVESIRETFMDDDDDEDRDEDMDDIEDDE